MRSPAQLLRDSEEQEAAATASSRPEPPAEVRLWSFGSTEAGGLATDPQGRSNTSQRDAGTKASATGHDAVVAVVEVGDKEAGEGSVMCGASDGFGCVRRPPLTGKDFIVFRPKAGLQGLESAHPEFSLARGQKPAQSDLRAAISRYHGEWSRQESY